MLPDRLARDDPEAQTGSPSGPIPAFRVEEPFPVRTHPVVSVCVGVLVWLGPSWTWAQQERRDPDAFLNQQRAIEEQVREELEAAAPMTRKVEFDWGGWFSHYTFLFDDGINSSRTYRQTDLRVWGRFGLEGGAHRGYARGRLSYKDFNSGDSYTGRDNDWDGMNLERGYYEFDLRDLVRYRRGRHLDYNLHLKMGRDLVEWGTGYAISIPLDHLAVTGEYADFELTGLFGRTPSSLDDIDRTRAGTGTNRNFIGFQAKYKGIANHEPFFYTMWQRDHKHTRYKDFPFQRFEYDSVYFGFGSRGQLVRDLLYSTEWVFERGHGYNDRRFLHNEEIYAWGFDATLNYLPRVRTSPNFTLEYMFASGDADRLGSPTNALGGNTRGNDHSFVGFGYRDTGLSFAPRMSNVHIWRAGASFYPFEELELLRKMELGTDWFLYHKHRRGGAVSDGTADRQSGYLGWEMDLFTNWKVTSDLSVTMRYGVFFPGEAFSDRTTRTFFLTGLTWSF